MVSWNWDAEQDSDGLVHQSVANTDNDNTAILKQGYDYNNFSEITPTPDNCWPLQEDSGTTATDVAGTNDGTVSGTTLGATGILNGTAYSFDGTDDYVDLNAAIFPTDTTQPWSAMAWIKHTAPADEMIFGQANEGGQFRGTYALLTSSTTAGAIRVQIRDDSSDQIDKETTGSYNDGAWHHVVTTYDGSQDQSGFTIYVDGSAVSTTSTQNDAIADTYTTTDAAIGARDPSSPGAFWAGDVTNVYKWSSELSAAQVQTLYEVVGTPGVWTSTSKTAP